MEKIYEETKGKDKLSTSLETDKETKKQQSSEAEEITLVIPDYLTEVEYGEEGSSHKWLGNVVKLLVAFCVGVIVACILLLK